MDTFAVSLSGGTGTERLTFFHALKIAFLFAVVQAFMPLAGWQLGHAFYNLIEAFDHWIAFLILLFIGGKMIYEATLADQLQPEKESKDSSGDFYKFKVVFVLALATSIDALAVGLSLSVLNLSILLPMVIIGLVTFFFAMFGLYLGKQVASHLTRNIEWLGGAILIGIGVRILTEHLIKGI